MKGQTGQKCMSLHTAGYCVRECTNVHTYVRTYICIHMYTNVCEKFHQSLKFRVEWGPHRTAVKVDIRTTTTNNTVKPVCLKDHLHIKTTCL